MKDFLCIYEMLLDELANYKISEVAALGQKYQLEITKTSIRSELHQLLSPIIDPLLVNIYHSKKNQGIVVGECREHRVSSFIGSFSIDELFSNYPLVEEAIKTRIFDFLELQQEIITRYYSEYSLISSTFLNDYGKIKKITTSLGDWHDGRSVSLVHCDNGIVVYKPHSLQTDQFLKEILMFFSNKLNTEIRVPRFVSFEHHAWQEYIEFSECEDIDELHEFYYKIGIYLAIFYLLSTCDMHHENLIAFGKYPIFFDTESLITSTLVGNDPSYRLLPNTVLNTAVLPTYDSSGIYEINFSAIFTGRVSPVEKEVPVLKQDPKNDFVFEKEKRLLIQPKQINVPALSNGYELPIEKAVYDVESGFEQALAVALEYKPELVDIYKTPSYMTMELRQVLRPTKVYYSFLLALNSPDGMASKSAQEDIIDILFDNFSANSATGYLRVQFEVEQLRQGYIPKFHAEYSTTDLYAYRGIVCKNYFKKSPLDLICEKLLALDEETICYQKRLIAMAMQTVAINDFNKLGNECISECNDVSELKKITQEYAESIAANAICCGDSLYTYMMLFPSDDSSHFLIKYIDSALYHGGGMVMFLLSYGHYMDAAPIKALGKKMLDGFILNYIHEKQTGNFSIDDGALYSLYDGYGGLLFLCGFVVQVIEDDGYKPFYNKLLNDILEYYSERQITEKDFDYMHGLSGTLSAICRIECMYRENADILPDIRIQQLSARYFNSSKDFCWNEYGRAHGLLGICQTLVDIYAYTQETKYLEQSDTFFDLCKEAACKEDLSWCKGKTGLLSVFINLLSAHKKDGEYYQKNHSVLKKIISDVVESYLNQSSLCICHGVYGAVDVLLTAKKEGLLTNQSYIKLQRSVKSLLGYPWFNSTNAPFESYMMGGTGVGYVLLRMLNDDLNSALL